ncbi:AbiH family protein [Olivibacter jilunii]|uniref:AbiH family protein n=1 Tax=Olivibacter jilunii TaxID=985016 RepID=UPI003F155D14
MNKLIIIGNGFDLAHGYPTRYSDFILWLVKKELKTVYESRHQSHQRENPLFHCIVNANIYVDKLIDEYLDETVLSIVESNTREYVPLMYIPDFDDDLPTGHNNVFTINPKSDFAKKLLKNTCENWVDIEQTYYKCLKEILNNSIKNGSPDFQETLTELNLQLSYLCEQLRDYLASLHKEAFIPEFKSILNKEIDYSELFKPEDWKEAIDIDLEELAKKSKTLVLNFNYTDTVEQYFNSDEAVVINNIHGSINGESNPMIFGYGDELDDDFSLMEKQEIKGFLEHVKSLWYLRTRNYHNLIRFLELSYYQVQIIGHSCGRSDRTLLNMVFEHENCNSVDIYYRNRSDGTDSFNEIAEEVSRQFKDKQKLRKRVLPKNSANLIPQFSQVIEEKIA